MHRRETATREDANNACAVAQAVYWLFVAHMLTALGLYVFHDGVISPTEYSRPVRTVKDKNGRRVIAEDIGTSPVDTLAGHAVLPAQRLSS